MCTVACNAQSPVKQASVGGAVYWHDSIPEDAKVVFVSENNTVSTNPVTIDDPIVGLIDIGDNTYSVHQRIENRGSTIGMYIIRVRQKDTKAGPKGSTYKAGLSKDQKLKVYHE